MPFPTVKSNPYQAGLKRRRQSVLWSAEFWKRLVEQAKADCTAAISEECLRMIGEMNEMLYGKP